MFSNPFSKQASREVTQPAAPPASPASMTLPPPPQLHHELLEQFAKLQQRLSATVQRAAEEARLELEPVAESAAAIEKTASEVQRLETESRGLLEMIEARQARLASLQSMRSPTPETLLEEELLRRQIAGYQAELEEVETKKAEATTQQAHALGVQRQRQDRLHAKRMALLEAELTRDGLVFLAHYKLRLFEYGLRSNNARPFGQLIHHHSDTIFTDLVTLTRRDFIIGFDRDIVKKAHEHFTSLPRES